MMPLKLLSFALLVLETSLASPVKHESPIAPLHVPDVETRHLLNDSYIVMFKDDIPPSVFAMHLSFVGFAVAAHPLLASDIRDVDSGLEHVYDSVVAKGYAGRFSPGVLEMIRGRPEVKFVEQDVRTCANDVQNGAPWVRSPFLPHSTNYKLKSLLLGPCTHQSPQQAYTTQHALCLPIIQWVRGHGLRPRHRRLHPPPRVRRPGTVGQDIRRT